jgi:hypothetical protein
MCPQQHLDRQFLDIVFEGKSDGSALDRDLHAASKTIDTFPTRPFGRMACCCP